MRKREREREREKERETRVYASRQEEGAFFLWCESAARL